MRYVVTGRQMKAIDEYTINKTGIPSLVLMERAAYSVYEEIRNHYDTDTNILIVCGSGNNGADGVALARILMENNYNADVFMAGNQEHFTDEMKHQLHIAQNLGINIVNKTNMQEYNLVIDALFGIGLSRDIEGRYYNIISDINNSDADVMAVDTPSGVNSETGNIMGIAIRADITVTFGFVKQGLLLYPGADYAGKIITKNVGFPKEAIQCSSSKCFMPDESDIESMLPKRRNDSNKGSYGRLLAAVGTVNMCGAACMCSKAAYRMGTGLVKVFTPVENRVIIQTSIPEAVLSTYDTISFDVSELKEDIKSSTCVVCGSGLGISDTAEKIVKTILESKVKTVLDADALNIISRNKSLENLYHENVIITPHIGEFSRLTGLKSEEIKSNPVNVCREYALSKGITCVLKDARTVTSFKDGTSWINVSGNSGMSTAGSGDVLAGIISALISQGMDMESGAVLGTFIHGLAGDEAKKSSGEYGMTAMDIADGIKNVLKKYESKDAR